LSGTFIHNPINDSAHSLSMGLTVDAIIPWSIEFFFYFKCGFLKL
jgi:hypothetical protein